MATSSNLVEVSLISEASYGVTPTVGNFNAVRFTSESLSGSPDTVESQFIRTDRMSSGQVVTSLAVEGTINYELAKDEVFHKLIESAMYNEWVVSAPVLVDLSIEATVKTITRTAGSFLPDVKIGDVVTLLGFTSQGNNTQVMIKSVTALVLGFEGPTGVVTEVGVGTSYKIADKITIGKTKKSFSIQKKFTDMTDKGLVYRGMIVSEMEFNTAYGELVTSNAALMGKEYSSVSSAADFITASRTILPQETTLSLNGSVDMPVFMTDASGSFSQQGLDVQSISLKLNNNLAAQNVIGNVAPKDYTPGTCNINTDLSIYLTDPSWVMLPKKLTQDPFSLGYILKNSGGFYGFFVKAIQLTFDDPSSGGQNQDVMFEATGVAKVGPSGESSIVIYKG